MQLHRSGFILLETMLAVFIATIWIVGAFDSFIFVTKVIFDVRKDLRQRSSRLTLLDTVLRDVWAADPRPESWDDGAFIKKLYDKNNKPCLAKIRYSNRSNGLFRWEQRYNFEQRRWLQPTAVNLGRFLGTLNVRPLITNSRVVAAEITLDTTLCFTARLRNTYVA